MGRSQQRPQAQQAQQVQPQPQQGQQALQEARQAQQAQQVQQQDQQAQQVQPQACQGQQALQAQQVQQQACQGQQALQGPQPQPQPQPQERQGQRPLQEAGQHAQLGHVSVGDVQSSSLGPLLSGERVLQVLRGEGPGEIVCMPYFVHVPRHVGLACTTTTTYVHPHTTKAHHIPFSCSYATSLLSAHGSAQRSPSLGGIHSRLLPLTHHRTRHPSHRPPTVDTTNLQHSCSPLLRSRPRAAHSGVRQRPREKVQGVLEPIRDGPRSTPGASVPHPTLHVADAGGAE